MNESLEWVFFSLIIQCTCDSCLLDDSSVASSQQSCKGKTMYYLPEGVWDLKQNKIQCFNKTKQNTPPLIFNIKQSMTQEV